MSDPTRTIASHAGAATPTDASPLDPNRSGSGPPGPGAEAAVDWRLDEAAFGATLADTPLAPWRDALSTAVGARGTALRHGDLPRWRDALARLPDVEVRKRTLDAAVVSAEGPFADPDGERRLRDALLTLAPWRKGPFRLANVELDCEWRSDLKWARLAPHIEPLAGRVVLDVGCGSGYHLWRMRGAGAALVLGIDPGLLFRCQFDAVQRYLQDPRIAFLPLTLDALPPSMACFDTVFSMGVLYHRRDPAAHLAELRGALRPGGELVLETLLSPAEPDSAISLAGRYARMRNVWTLPSARRVERWLGEGGFVDVRTANRDITSTREQRSTPWSGRESLIDALDPLDPSRTVEGHPRPRRAVLLARRPS